MKWLQELFQPAKSGLFGPEGALRPGGKGRFEWVDVPNSGGTAKMRRWVRPEAAPAPDTTSQVPSAVTTRSPAPRQVFQDQPPPGDGAPQFVIDQEIAQSQGQWPYAGSPGVQPMPPSAPVPWWIVMQQLLQGQNVYPYADRDGGGGWG